MKTLLVDGQWNLKRNFYKRKNYSAKGELCGGSFGFLDSLRNVINNILPDRVVVMWDGLNSGKLRYDIYKPYKAKRKKYWEKEYETIVNEYGEQEQDQEKLEILKQKLVINEFLDKLSIRHLEIQLIEADDLIGYYILTSKLENEEIIIYSRDNDYNHLISNRVSVLNPDSLSLITIKNFKNKYGYVVENALLLKCFEGDKSDGIKGVGGVTSKKLLELFPRLSEEKYSYNRIVEETYEKRKQKKLKIYDKIINAREILYRNAKLMNLKQPFINKETVLEMEKIINNKINQKNETKDAMFLFFQKGFNKFVNNEYTDMFFLPFYRIIAKEREFNQKK